MSMGVNGFRFRRRPKQLCRLGKSFLVALAAKARYLRFACDSPAKASFNASSVFDIIISSI